MFVIQKWLLRQIIWLMLVCLALTISVAPTAAQQMTGDVDAVQTASVDPDRMLIGLVDGATRQQLADQLAGSNWQVARIWPALGLAELTARTSSFAANGEDVASAALEQQQMVTSLPAVEFAEFDGQVFAADRSRRASAAVSEPSALQAQEPMPDDPLAQQQWAIARLGALSGWGVTQGDSQVVVALIDSGYDLDHEDIDQASLWINPLEAVGAAGADDDQNGFVDDLYGWDWVENNQVTNDPYGHGSHVGATIAATTNNQLGVVGFGRSVRIMALRILDRNGGGTVSDLVDAINYARVRSARIINLSLVMTTPSQALQKAVQQASQDGLILVAASGNANRTVAWPAAFPEVVAVGASDRDDVRGSFSNYGPALDVVAPGVDIMSAYRAGAYQSISGTSMATPHVSALAGLIWSLRPDYTDEQVIDLIRTTAQDINASEFPGADDFVGAGRIDYSAALERASAELQVQPKSVTSGIVFAGEPVIYVLRVLTPASGDQATLPVSGAVMNYTVAPQNVTGTQEGLLSGRALSDVDGAVTIAFLAPEVRSSFLVSAAVGLAQISASLYVQIPPAQIEIAAPAPSIPAGDSVISLQLALRDANGQLAGGPMPLTLQAERGAFENGQRSIEMVVNDGAASVPFRPGPQAGSLLVRAQVGEVSGAATLNVQAQPPAQLIPLGIPETAAAGSTVEIVFAVQDFAGNPAANGIPVRIFSSEGTVTDSGVVQAGRVSAQVTLPRNYVGTVTVLAIATGTRLQQSADFNVLNQMWLPLVVK